ncbi:alpha-hydroxy acid oxidase [Burkholderia oklahomensis]|uniref:(S)-mandelate dehydrogenase n=1 Tax=Burkholderia oklahomensis TaxID=342113 RepID=A0AAI8B8H9_9BURK|nr:alpha-hydroxy acid oxidase [Burkholderia oklahomensis]AIO67637.1 (S)-mandelate dehydrogenase [Burkholderia oklahomensis]AJX32263.1 (S)-mandelate dehydrogenase [Burkholderia oklahomensis C6786]AOI42826.1 mandelate dehydrogenase [Burkholderia oklahomensis EO147]AOI46316.1 mandelate dehydrogenase [Burkholderia oklahomensis C6786]KUY53926.1 mandelate dehydrogenase [Burkholderia oklahomensis C6786]
MRSARLYSVEQYRHAARRHLPRFVFDYLEGGAGGEAGLRHNLQRPGEIRLHPRRLVNVSNVTTQAALFGRTYAAPIGIAPVGMSGCFRRGGDLHLATAAARANVPFVMSMASNSTVEEAVAIGGPVRTWFQLYVMEAALSDALLADLRAAGCETLVVTVDVPVSGKRERDLRNGFALPFRLRPAHCVDVLRTPRYWRHGSRLADLRLRNIERVLDVRDPLAQASLLRRQMDMTFDAAALRRIRAAWPGRLIVKGILRASDALACVSAGADAIVVSNHGGRQIDSCVSPFDVLAEVADAVRVPVLVDSGIRCGEDVLKALAMGASLVLVGRPAIYGLAVDGADGSEAVLRLLADELRLAMALCGCRSVAAIDRDLLYPERLARRSCEWG